MTTMYRCDRCGKTFTDYEEAHKHECSHWIVSRGYSAYDDAMDAGTEYKESWEEPSVVHIRFERWNPETMETEYRFGKFKLVSSYKEPLEITNE